MAPNRKAIVGAAAACNLYEFQISSTLNMKKIKKKNSNNLNTEAETQSSSLNE